MKAQKRKQLKCDACGRYVKMGRKTVHRMTSPDCAFSGEEWETLCKNCKDK